VTRVIARPRELDLDSPGRRDYWVALEHDSIWGDHLLPLTVLVGPDARPGQGLAAFGANHGDEYEGPVALKLLLRELRLEDVRGRLILMPVLNAAAFSSGSRESSDDDGVNLNRAFVHGAGAQPALAGITHRIAAFVRSWIWPRTHVVIDLHAGGDVASFAPLTSFHAVSDPAQAATIRETARWFGVPFLLAYQDETPGLLPSDAEADGKIAIGCELGWGRALNRDGIAYARQGVLAAAIRHGQLAGRIEPMAHHRDGTQRVLAATERACVSVTPYAGHFEPIAECGEAVRVGQPLGRLHDFARIDEEPLILPAAVDGVLVARAWHARVRAGQHVAVVGKVVP
jgi:N-alpha-acetyl-L-2,4-diaminobutyrate deacetylase